MEFRCYVHEGSLLGIAQKDDTASFEFLQSEELLATIYERIKVLVESVTSSLVLPSYLLDVYVDIAPRYKAWV